MDDNIITHYSGEQVVGITVIGAKNMQVGYPDRIVMGAGEKIVEICISPLQ